MVAKAADTRAEIIREASAYVDQFGAHDLTLRVLGERLGMHHTAIYRHFRNKDELLAAVFLQISGDLLTQNAGIKDPKERLLALGLQIRKVQSQYPELSAALASSSGSGEVGAVLQRGILNCLREMGVPEGEIAVRYQAIESFVNGSSYFDLAGAPNHIRIRRLRHRGVGDPALDEATRTDEDTENMSEEAYRWGISALLEQAKTK